MKTSLELESKVVKLVEANKPDKFITDAYGLSTPYEIQPTEEAANDSYLMFHVSKEEYLVSI